MSENIMKPTYIVYKHTNKHNGKSYIGISSQSIQHRSGYNGKNYKRNKHFYAAIQKYGWSNFSHEILFDELSKENAEHKEIELIAKYKTNDFRYGYNLSSGGESGHSGCRMSDEEKLRRSQVYSGEGNPMYGKTGALSLHDALPIYAHKFIRVKETRCMAKQVQTIRIISVNVQQKQKRY